jgi:hypothetical protein
MKRVAVIVAGPLCAAAFLFPTVGFARTHSGAGLAAECSALNSAYNKLDAMETTATANSAPIIEGLEAKIITKYNGLGCSPTLPTT